jgi:hypothetical protein
MNIALLRKIDVISTIKKMYSELDKRKLHESYFIEIVNDQIDELLFTENYNTAAKIFLNKYI